jgi:hypothetical protein
MFIRRNACPGSISSTVEFVSIEHGYAMHYSRSHDAVIRVYDAAGNIIATHEHNGDFKGW